MIRQVILDRSSRKKDKSVSLTFITSLEQSTDEFMEIDRLTNQYGLIYFKSEGHLTSEEVKLIDNAEVEVEGKTKSQRLRNTIYRVWEKGNKDLLFDVFYAEEMEKIISHYKTKLD